jgi:hypothetical protein
MKSLIFGNTGDETVLLHKILGLDENENIFLAEESLADLTTLPVTGDLLASGFDFDQAIGLAGKSLLGIAIHSSNPDFWLFLTDHFSDDKVVDRYVQDLQIETIGAFENDYLDAVIEYYSLSLADELLCESCMVEGTPLYADDRIDRLESLLRSSLPTNINVLEICCGSGMATQQLHNLGYSPWVVDVDRCEVCQALKAGLLHPARTLVLDARLLQFFFRPASFDAVLGFMVGLIDDVNWDMWKDILVRSSNLASKMILYTVYTKREALLVAEVLDTIGWDGEIIDNRDSTGIYDQWAYLAKNRR